MFRQGIAGKVKIKLPISVTRTESICNTTVALAHFLVTTYSLTIRVSYTIPNKN